MKAYLISTRGRRPFTYTVVLVASDKPGLESFRCNLLSDPLAQLTRLGSVEIIVAKESERAQVEAFEQNQDIEAFLRWLDAGLKEGAAPEPAPGTPTPPPSPPPPPQPPPQEQPTGTSGL